MEAQLDQVIGRRLGEHELCADAGELGVALANLEDDVVAERLDARLEAKPQRHQLLLVEEELVLRERERRGH